MKDKFFSLLYSVYVSIYRFVMRQVYISIDRERAKGCSPLKPDDKRAIYDYWGRYGLKPKLDDYRLYASRGLKPEPGLISTEIWAGIIEPNHNALKYCGAFTDKNYFDLVLGKENTPDTVVRCISGSLLDGNYRPVTAKMAAGLLNDGVKYILKPTIDSGGGRGVSKVSGADIDAEQIERACADFDGNFCVQEIFKQHEFLKSFNPTSVQSVRVVSVFLDGKVDILCASMRIGKAGSVVDNFVSGGYAVNIDVATGTIGDKLVDHDMKVYTAQETGMKRSGERIPFWEDAKQLVCDLHPRLAHFGIISWDVTLDESGTPKIIEYNLIDSLVDWHQIFIGPILGNKDAELLPKLLKKNPYIQA